MKYNGLTKSGVTALVVLGLLSGGLSAQQRRSGTASRSPVDPVRAKGIDRTQGEQGGSFRDLDDLEAEMQRNLADLESSTKPKFTPSTFARDDSSLLPKKPVVNQPPVRSFDDTSGRTSKEFNVKAERARIEKEKADAKIKEQAAARKVAADIDDLVADLDKIPTDTGSGTVKIPEDLTLAEIKSFVEAASKQPGAIKDASDNLILAGIRSKDEEARFNEFIKVIDRLPNKTAEQNEAIKQLKYFRDLPADFRETINAESVLTIASNPLYKAYEADPTPKKKQALEEEIKRSFCKGKYKKYCIGGLLVALISGLIVGLVVGLGGDDDKKSEEPPAATPVRPVVTPTPKPTGVPPAGGGDDTQSGGPGGTTPTAPTPTPTPRPTPGPIVEDLEDDEDVITTPKPTPKPTPEEEPEQTPVPKPTPKPTPVTSKERPKRKKPVRTQRKPKTRKTRASALTSTRQQYIEQRASRRTRSSDE